MREDYSIWIEGKVETLTLELEIGWNNILISEVYKPPNTQWDEFALGFGRVLNEIQLITSKFICIGDFNFDFLNSDNLEFFTTIVTHDLYLIVGILKRVTQHSATLIDTYSFDLAY